ncbi:hypothetical protein QVD17_26717 [Tagetes erecta]|uniref:Uncharacterized protein n=1 Tax=Tagetes erecta TaxID=13708 RepID=A0AAD8NQK5_TARER|nr:hypothetical protein QVD17_26717 [Tagetes erecta]
MVVRIGDNGRSKGIGNGGRKWQNNWVESELRKQKGTNTPILFKSYNLDPHIIIRRDAQCTSDEAHRLVASILLHSMNAQNRL